MSLLTDKFFNNALNASDDIVEMVDGRIFNPARSTVDEEEDKIPYIIIMFEGLQNMTETKDESVEGDEDNVTVSILCVSNSCDSLGEMTEAVRQQCVSYWESEDDEYRPIDWTLSASRVEYDPEKPCCYQTLTYQCRTNK